MNKTIKNRLIKEVRDIYSNVNFKDGAVAGGSRPSKDTINTSLLKDIQTAAKNANLNVDVTTAVSGHRPGTRHETGNAVDIAIINGKSVSLSNRSDADKLVSELIKLGYAKNVAESGNDKVVLTFGMKDHDNHVHVSNSSGSKTTTTDDENSNDTESNDEDGGVVSDFAKRIGNLFFPTSVDISSAIREDIDRIKELLK
jgi:hypothetical protein